MKNTEIVARTEELVTPIIEENHFELVDVEYVKEGANWYLRVYADKEGGINIDDCVLISRALEAKLDEEDLIKDGNYNYVLLNRSYGLDTTFTANAWNVVDKDVLYLCCTDGVRALDTKKFMGHSTEYDMVLGLVEADGIRITEKDGVFNIPAGTKRLMLGPAVLNYTASNPLICLKLEGSGDEGLYIRQTDMTDMYYTNIPYGNYTLRMQIVDELTGDILKEDNFFINKPALFHETGFFRLLISLLITGAVAFLAWFGAKVSNMALINRQYEQIKEAKEEAEYANHAKSRFLANMSHEIRTPINAVLGLDEMILRESTEKEIRSYAHDIYTSANTLLSLINDILDSSKIESGKMEIVPVEYELITLVRDLVNMISQKARTKDLKLIINLDEKLPSKLFGDDVRIRQVVTNILTNAVKYTPQGFVTFSVSGRREEEDEILTFTVEDTGIGIKEEDLPKLFEEYQRIEEGRNRNIEGTGLGMNITIQLLALMGSHLEVSSVYGEGSKFWFNLRQKIVDDAPVGNFEESMNSPGERYSYEGGFEAPDAKILVVDDNEMNLKVFKSLLKITKIKVTTAAGGRQAIDLASKERFDIIFTDHMMPDMDGIETLHHLRELDNCNGVPIYVLTANAVTGAREQYMEAGFDGRILRKLRGVHKIDCLSEDEKLIAAIEETGVRANAPYPEQREHCCNIYDAATGKKLLTFDTGLSTYISQPFFLDGDKLLAIAGVAWIETGYNEHDDTLQPPSARNRALTRRALQPPSARPRSLTNRTRRPLLRAPRPTPS